MADGARKPILDWLRFDPIFPWQPIIWDGGMGTALQDRGLEVGEAPESWNLERPDEVREVHREFFEAGANVVQTNTFGGNRARLRAAGLEDHLEEINRTAVGLAMEHRPATGYVVGTMGPTGLGETAEITDVVEEIEELYAEQAASLGQAGVDAIHAETLSGRSEALAALRGARRGADQDLPVFVSITLRRDGGTYRTLAGEAPLDVLLALVDQGAYAIGVNCMLDPAEMRSALEHFAGKLPPRPFIAQPIAPTATGPGLTLAEVAHDLRRAGAHAIGGCCGTTPAEIAALVERIRSGSS